MNRKDFWENARAHQRPRVGGHFMSQFRIQMVDSFQPTQIRFQGKDTFQVGQGIDRCMEKEPFN